MQKTICATILLLYLSGFCMVHAAVTKTIHVEPTPVNEPLVLTPDVYKDGEPLKSNWNYIAPLGSRIRVKCDFYVKSCEQVMFEFSERDHFNRICPTKSLTYTYMTKSNTLNIGVINKWNKPGAMCRIFVTIPYVNQPEIIIDSSEFGRENNATKKPSCRCGWTNKSRKRIMGGNEAEVNEYPFAVILYHKKLHYYFCDASIITNRHLLSTAHCFPDIVAEDVAVNVGDHDTLSLTETRVTTLRHDALQLIHHPDYNKPLKFDNDVSIVVLKQWIKFNQYVGPVCLPEQLFSLTGQVVKVIGFGFTNPKGPENPHSKQLMETYLNVIDYSVCQLSYDNYVSQTVINNSQFCTYAPGKGTCQGDSGGPVVLINPETNMFQQVGLISYGGKCATVEPEGSTNVAYYIDWIKKQVAATKPGELCF